MDWKPEDSGTTQKEDVKKTPGKMLPSILSKHSIVIFIPTMFIFSTFTEFAIWSFTKQKLSCQFVF